VPDWEEQARRAEERYRDGEGRLPDEPDARQRQLTRMGNAAWAAGLAALMQGEHERSRAWLRLAAERYRESYDDAPPGSWGRPIAVLKAQLLAGEDASDAARWTLGEGAAASPSAIGRYAAALARAVLGEWEEVRVLADGLRTGDEFPTDVADALAFVAAEDVLGYVTAVESVLASFEARAGYLEDVPVADTVLVLQALAARRGLAPAELESPLYPSR
jgi:hypothetical protein